MELKFGLIGDGKISERHKVAVVNNGGQITEIYDPKYNNKKIKLDKKFFEDKDYIIICSPSNFHRDHIKLALKYNKKIIVEKPMVLPWESIIDDDKINVVLQLRWMDLPSRANLIKIIMVRDKDYFKSWKGDPKNTGGLFYNLFIHYIDLATIIGANFEGLVKPEGKQVRMIDDIDISKIDMDELYIKMYNDIVNHNKGVKPKDFFYLHWLLNRNSNIYGFGKDALNKYIYINNKLGE